MNAHTSKRTTLSEWYWVWRKLHCMADMRKDDCGGSGGWRPDYQYIDIGYCLDRYSVRDSE